MKEDVAVAVVRRPTPSPAGCHRRLDRFPDEEHASSAATRQTLPLAALERRHRGERVVDVGVEVGDGLVARFGDAVLLVVEPASTANVPRTCSPPSRPPPRRRPGRRERSQPAPAAIVASREPGTTPPFGAVAPLADGYVVLLHGPVSAEIASPLGVVRLSGEQAVTWVDYKVEVAVDRLSVTSHDHPVQVDPMSDLRAGLVPGSGFVVTPGRSTDAPQREAASARPVGHCLPGFCAHPGSCALSEWVSARTALGACGTEAQRGQLAI